MAGSRQRWLRRIGIGLIAGMTLAPVSAPLPVRADTPLTTEMFANLVEKVSPAVVNIDTVSRRRVSVVPFVGRIESRTLEQRGLGSGFIIDANGWILTNNHVIQGANDVEVTLNDGRKFPAKLVGRDPSLDLAVIRIDAHGLPALKLADDRSVRVGDWVLAIGSPLGLDKTVTKGIVSALHRHVAINESVQFIQTDAPINPGNSGGPLINLAGNVIGVNTAVAAQAQGIGFAIPAGVAKRTVDELKAHGRIRRAWLGVAIQEITPERARQAGIHPGLVVVQTYQGTGAAAVGLTEGDEIVAVDNTPTPSIAALRQLLSRKEPGQKVSVTFLRDNKRHNVNLTLSDMPAETIAP